MKQCQPQGLFVDQRGTETDVDCLLNVLSKKIIETKKEIADKNTEQIALKIQIHSSSAEGWWNWLVELEVSILELTRTGKHEEGLPEVDSLQGDQLPATSMPTAGVEQDL